MKKFIVSSLALISLSLVFTAAASAQQFGTRVEANIPFDFVVGDETFAAGKYEMVLVRNFGSVYNVLVRDEKGRSILKTTAIQNGSTNREQSDLVFAVSDGGRLLENLRTPVAGFRFTSSGKNKQLAQAKRVTVPTEASPN